MEFSRRALTRYAIAGSAEVAASGHLLPPAVTQLQRLVSGDRSSQSRQLKDVRVRLFDIERRIGGDPKRFQELAPEVGMIATELFCDELREFSPESYQQDILVRRLNYEQGAQYLRTKEVNTGCRVVSTPSDEAGYVHFESTDIHINLSFFLRPGSQVLLEYPAVQLCTTIVHEHHHAISPMRRFTPARPFLDTGLNRIVGLATYRGVTAFATVAEQSLPGRSCARAYRHQVEEAVVQQSTDQIMKRIGASAVPVEEYNRWVSAYQRWVLDRWFKGDNKTLLQLHQKSEFDQFYRTIGKLWGAPDDKSEVAGSVYLRYAILSNMTPPQYSESLLQG